MKIINEEKRKGTTVAVYVYPDAHDLDGAIELLMNHSYPATARLLRKIRRDLGPPEPTNPFAVVETFTGDLPDDRTGDLPDDRPGEWIRRPDGFWYPINFSVGVRYADLDVREILTEGKTT